MWMYVVFCVYVCVCVCVRDVCCMCLCVLMMCRPQAQQQVAAFVRGTTKYNELPIDYKRKFIQIE